MTQDDISAGNDVQTLAQCQSQSHQEASGFTGMEESGVYILLEQDDNKQANITERHK